MVYRMGEKRIGREGKIMARCECDYNRDGKSLFRKSRHDGKVYCGATNQPQVPRPTAACLHLLRLARHEAMPQQYKKRRTVKPTRAKTFR